MFSLMTNEEITCHINQQWIWLARRKISCFAFYFFLPLSLFIVLLLFLGSGWGRELLRLYVSRFSCIKNASMLLYRHYVIDTLRRRERERRKKNHVVFLRRVFFFFFSSASNDRYCQYREKKRCSLSLSSELHDIMFLSPLWNHSSRKIHPGMVVVAVVSYVSLKYIQCKISFFFRSI